ncbi:SAM hydroxide adenosyltransferase [Chloroflexota bacterium]
MAAIFGSSGYLEISLTNGNAANFLNINIGDVLSVAGK